MTVRPARPTDAIRIAEIYCQGIEDRVATFQTSPRTSEDILKWFASVLPKVVVELDGEVVAYAAAFPYSDRCCYDGVAEFSVYVARDRRGIGAGKLAMQGLIEAARAHGLHKLLSRVFPENLPSLTLLERVGFRRVGVHQKHGQLDGVWRDVISVELVIEENL